MFCEKCQKGFAPGNEELNLPTGFRLEINQDHQEVTAICNQCNGPLRRFRPPQPPIVVEKVVEKVVFRSRKKKPEG